MKTQTRLRLRQPTAPVACMPRVNGKSFRCRCGCNVFTRRSGIQWLHRNIYVCNACGTVYA